MEQALPQGFLERMERLLGPEYAAFLASYGQPRRAGLRLNPLKAGPRPELEPYSLEPVPWAKNGYFYDPDTRPGLNPYHEAGLYYLQEPSAMAPAELLDVRPGMRVLDLCAAPGGKTTQLAAALAGEGILVSNEINPKRAAILARNVERLGVANALVVQEHPKALAARFPGWFDRILVDAPCSGEGMFRREPAAVSGWSLEAVEQCAQRQGEILRTAASMLAPGGRLVYSTCTFAPQENEGVISQFLKENPDFSLVPASGGLLAPGRPEWVEDPAPGLEGTCRLWPHLLPGEGHFAAVLQREGQLPERSQEPPRSRRDRRKTPDKALAQAEGFLRAFQEEAGVTLPQEGRLALLGSTLWLLPQGAPELDGLKVLRFGLELGRVRKDRLEPAHAWALWLHTAASVADFPAKGPEIAAYLRGAPLSGPQKGWTLVTADGLSLGWAKGSGGTLKNHFPKALYHLAQGPEL